MTVINEAMDRFLASFQQEERDLEGRARSLAQDVVVSDWMAPGEDLRSEGEATQAFYEPIVESFPDVQFEVTGSIRDGNKLLVTGFFTGTMEKDYWGFPAHGRKVRWEARDIYQFNQDGLIDRIWFANDTLTVARELGADMPDDRLW